MDYGLLYGMDLNKRRIGAYLKGSGKPSPDAAGSSALPDRAANQPAEEPAALIKVTPARKSPSNLPPPSRKTGATDGGKPKRADIARYLVLIGKDEAANILRHLEPAEVEAIAQEIAKIPSISPDEAKEVLQRFQGLVVTGIPAAGGLETARSMLVNAFGTEKGDQILRQAMPEVREPFFNFLHEMESSQISLLLRGESIGARSIILSSLPAQVAAGVIKLLPRDEQKELIVRMSRMNKVEREVIERMDTALREKVKNLESAKTEDLDGSSNLAAIMRHLDPDMEQRLLGVLQEEAPDVVDGIKDRLFTIDTVLLIDDRDLQKVLQTLENKQFALILKGKDEKIRNKLLDNVSDNRRTQILDDYVTLGPQPKRDVDQATRDFIVNLRSLEQEGRIVVRRDDEMYV